MSAIKIAIFDHSVVPNNPAGSCHLYLIRGLSEQYQFTVFAISLDGSALGTVRMVKVPAVPQPSVLRFWTFRLVAFLRYHLDRQRSVPDLTQSVLPYGPMADIGYAHFCSTAYLRRERARGIVPKTLRDWVRWATHSVVASTEPRAYRRSSLVVTPSEGLKRELSQTFGIASERMTVIPNPIDIPSLSKPRSHDSGPVRASLGLSPDSELLVFMALGHFERKGLKELLVGIHRLHERNLHLVVVGGRPKAIQRFGRLAETLAIDRSVHFVGFQADVRPFLWAGDAFVFPSKYETFGLAVFQAAAAGLPLLTTAVYGVEEILSDGENGFRMADTDPDIIQATIRRFLSLEKEQREAMGRAAARSVQGFGLGAYAGRWDRFYREHL